MLLRLNRLGTNMKKINLIVSILVMVGLVFSVVTASMLIPASDNAKENAKAPEKSPVITETGSGNWELERVDFIHYARPPKPPKGPKTNSCYKLLGVKWKSLPVSYVINPDNPQGLTEEFVTTTISTSAETWDDATLSEISDDVYTVDYNAEFGIQNFENAIDFGVYPDNNVIAVTSIWFTRKGRQIVEFDIRFNIGFSWGDAELNPLVMDLQNIAVHELGHGFGLDDIYNSVCSTVTMYGYSTEGETDKRTLEQPDISGLQKMYGI